MKVKCIRPGCGKPEFSRGLCSACYSNAALLVRKGQTSWEQLVNSGRALRAYLRKKSSKTRKWLLEGVMEK